MKTTLSVVVMACLAFMAIPKTSFSQTKSNISNLLTISAPSLIVPMTTVLSPSLTVSIAKMAAINANLNAKNKAFRNFNRSNKNAMNVTWSDVQGGFIAHFSTLDLDRRVVYNKRGVWQYNLDTYMEESLPTDIRNLVKQQYYNCKILVCYTYEINGSPVYIVKMEDNKTIKTLKIFNDEIIDTKNYSRG